MEAKVFDQKGKEKGTVALPEAVFGLPWNADLVHTVLHSLESSSRTPVAHTKTRGEVRGGGKKPWRQKGTGRARHGSNRSPIWVGGGVAHGPRNDKNFDRKVNKKEKAKALATVLSAKLRDGEILFIDSLSFDAPKTKDAKEVLVSLAKVKGFEALGRRNNAALIATGEKSKNLEKSFANFGNVIVSEARSINIPDILSKRVLVFVGPESSVKALESVTSKKK